MRMRPAHPSGAGRARRPPYDSTEITKIFPRVMGMVVIPSPWMGEDREGVAAFLSLRYR
jgi:hypothetical protein